MNPLLTVPSPAIKVSPLGRWVRRAARILMFASLGLGIILLLSLPGTGGGELLVEPANLNLGEIAPKQELDIPFRLVNRTGGTVQVLGAHETCGPTGCGTVPGLPVVVPPGEVRTVTLHFKSGSPGEFTKETPLFTDFARDPLPILRVSGVVKTAKDEPSSGADGTAPPNR